MIKYINRFFLTNITLFSIVSSVGALELGNVLTITPGMGWQVYHKARELKNGPFYHVTLGVNFTPEWSLEGTTGYLATKFKNTKRDHDGTHSFLTALYHFAPEQKFVPYIVGGIGRLSLTQVNGRDKHHTTYQGGVGIKFFLNDRVALRTDVRAMTSRARGFRHKDVLINIGLMFQLGEQATSRSNLGMAHANSASYEQSSNVSVYHPNQNILPDKVLIKFDYNSAMVKPQFNSKLSQVVAYLQQHPNATVKLEGRADSHGSKQANLRISKRRVDAVSGLLQNMGIIKERIEKIAVGFSNDQKDSNMGDQRVVLIQMVE